MSSRVIIGVVLGVLVVAAAPLEAQGTLRIAAYNVKHGLGMDSVIDLDRIADVLRPLEADVITLQEIDSGTERTDGVNQAGGHQPSTAGWRRAAQRAGGRGPRRTRGPPRIGRRYPLLSDPRRTSRPGGLTFHAPRSAGAPCGARR